MEWGDGLAGWEIAGRIDKAHHYIERIVDSTRKNRGGNEGEEEGERS